MLHQSSTESSLDVSLEFLAGEQIIRFVIVGFRGKEHVVVDGFAGNVHQRRLSYVDKDAMALNGYKVAQERRFRVLILQSLLDIYETVSASHRKSSIWIVSI